MSNVPSCIRRRSGLYNGLDCNYCSNAEDRLDGQWRVNVAFTEMLPRRRSPVLMLDSAFKIPYCKYIRRLVCCRDKHEGLPRGLSPPA